MAVNVTMVPAPKEAEQVAPQLMPPGELVTLPGPWPDRCAVSWKDVVELFGAKLALTDVAAFIATVQVPVPEQPPPLQPVNVALAEGMAGTVARGAARKDAEQVAPQLMPPGELVTVPEPKPDRCALSRKDEGNGEDEGEDEVLGAKLALTDAAAFIATVQVLVPEQPLPLQPVNVALAEGMA